MKIDFENHIKNIILPLLVHPNDLVVKKFSEEDSVLSIQVMVHKEDLGRVIGNKGRVANAIRTIAYASAAKEGKKVKINIESF